MAKTGIKVAAPATITNIAGGLTTLGLALESPADELIIKEGNQPGLVITEIQGASGKLSKVPEKNPAGIAANRLLAHLGQLDRPLSIEIHKKIPMTAGMGSSAGLAACGVFAVQEYLRAGLSKQELLPFALEGLKCTDNDSLVANLIPSLLGGMTLKTEDDIAAYKKLYIPAGLSIALIRPHILLPKQNDFQSILSMNIQVEASLQHAEQLAAFVASMYTSDMVLMTQTLQKTKVHPKISENIPYFDVMQEKAIQLGAAGFGVAGVGPSMYALCTDSGAAHDVIEAAKTLFASQKVDVSTYFSKINHEGAIAF
ncbi:MAG: homoserine kinase [Chitinophagales bacterium]|nr:homoserine kinase [Chitinophagales bacterium]